MTKERQRRIAPAVMLLSALTACNQSEGPAANFQELNAQVCSPDAGGFTIDIDNEYFPLRVGNVREFEGDEDGALMRLVVTVLNETEEVAGVTTRVVEEAEYRNGEVIEISQNYFVQASDGTVCYYGEIVDIYENGEITSHDGSWRAGEGENLPGIIMPGSPALETQWAQESAPGVAEDRSAISGINETIDVPAGTYNNLVHTIDWNPLDGQTSAGAEDKYYAPGIGLIVDNVVELVSVTD